MKTRDIESVFMSPLGQRACAYWVPINMLEKVRAAYKAEGKRVTFRWRGPRADQVGIPMPNGRGGFYARTSRQAKQDCLKAYATHFSVYTL